MARRGFILIRWNGPGRPGVHFCPPPSRLLDANEKVGEDRKSREGFSPPSFP